ncbi:MAG: IS200/IS605 family transposase [Planctomycetes bacterium]|nr:IS200/IS605 family transposase [Planctomycetota bacterium]
MAQSLAQIYVHIVFSTKERYPFIQTDIESQLYAYMADAVKRMNGIPCLINGTADHVHILSTLPRTVTLAKYIEEIKRPSSRWIKTKGGMYQKFAWQNGYGAFSVSSSRMDSVKRYIAGQKEHHRMVTFQDEFLEFLQKYNVNYDERYLWD